MLSIAFAVCLLASPNQWITKAEAALATAEKTRFSQAEQFTPHVRETPGGAVVTFTRTWQNLPVWESRLRRVNFDQSQKVTAQFPAAPLKPDGAFRLQPEQARKLAQAWLADQDERVIEAKQGPIVRGIFHKEQLTRQVYSVRVWVEKDDMMEPFDIFVDAANGKVLAKKQLYLHLQDEVPPQTGEGWIYRASPASASLHHDGDSQASRDAAIKQVTLKGLDGSGYLRGEFVNTVPSDEPTGLVLSPFAGYIPGAAFSESGQYFYEPDNAAFGEVTVYYWIDTAQRYLQSMNIQAFDRPIDVYVHSMDQHNAFYSPFDEEIHFGNGIVAMSHDVEVILHEYGHALLDDVVGDILLFDIEGRSLHEGFADYMSSIFQRAQQQDQVNDLHPEYLGQYFGLLFEDDPSFLRTLIEPPFTYADGLTNSPHRNGELWSSAFYHLDHEIGLDAFVTLLYEAMTRLPKFEHPSDLVAAFHEADQALNQGANEDLLNHVFDKRAFRGSEQNSQATVVQIGEEITLEEGLHIVQVHTNDAPQPFTIQIGEGSKELLLSRLQDNEYGQIDLYSYDSDIYSIPVAAKDTVIPLEANQIYELEIYIYENEPVSLSVADTVELFEATRIEQGLAYTPGDTIQGPLLFESEQAFDHILLWLESDRRGSIFVSQSAYGPPSGEEWSRVVEDLFLTVGDSDFYILPVHLNQPTTRLYFHPNFAEITSLRWQGVNLSTAEVLEAGISKTITAGANGLAVAQAHLPDDSGHGIITSNAETSFYVRDRDFRAVSTANVAGSQALYLSGNSVEFAPEGIPVMTAVPFQEPILVVATAQPLTQMPLLFEPSKSLPLTPIETAVPLQKTLQPGELSILYIDPPSITKGFAFSLASDVDNSEIFFQPFVLVDRKLFRNQRAYSLAEGASQVGLSGMEIPTTETDLINGGLYFWIINRGDQAETLDALIQLTEAVPTVETITADQVLQPQWVRNGASEFWWSIDIPVDPDTKRLALEVALPADADADAFGVWIRDQYNWVQAYSDGIITLGLAVLSNFRDPDTGKIRLWFTSDNPAQLPQTIELKMRQHTSPINYPVSESGSFIQTLAPSVRSIVQIDTHEPSRGILVGWDNESLRDDVEFRALLTRDSLLFDIPMARADIYGFQPDWLTHISQNPLLPLPQTNWHVRHSSFVRSIPGVVGIDIDSEPTYLRTEVALLPLATDTVLPPTVSAAIDNVATREVLAINPNDNAVTLNWNDQVISLAPGGFVQQAVSPTEALGLEADSPLAIFERMAGEAWETMTAPSPYRSHDMLLPHLPPSESGWNVFASLAHDGANNATLTTGSTFEQSTITPGHNTHLIEKATAGSWAMLQTARGNDSLLPEVSVSGTQYWTQDGHFAAEPAGVSASRTLYVPHFPKVSDWWVGMTLANPSNGTIRVTISPYGDDGLLFDQVRHVTLPGRESVTGLLESFIDADAVADVNWMRIHSEEGDFAGLAFIGTWRNGDDVAAFSLPTQTATGLLFPGPNSANWYGIAVTNTVAKSGDVLVEAVAPDGVVLDSFTHTLAANHKLLFTGSERFPNLGHGDYYLRVTSQDIRISGLVISGSGGLELSAQTPVLLP